MNRNIPIPKPPPGPADPCPEEGFNQSLYQENLSPERAEVFTKAFELNQEASECTCVSTTKSKLEQSLQLCLHSKTAERLSSCFCEQGDHFMALAFAGLGYALNPRVDKTATHFALLLYKHGESQRAWEIVSEILTRNNDYGPAWILLEKLEEER